MAELAGPVLLASLWDVHAHLAWPTVAANGLVGAWSLAAHRVRGLRLRSLWWFAALAQSLLFVQVGLGVGLVAGDGRDVAGFHMFYGFVALAAVGILVSYRSQLAAKRYLLYGWGGLFLMGLALRAMFVG